ncbi:aspartyl-phosphate phosphatase Spo0E family protein [Saliterribacillus persicus]|uniref:Spo0E like sporulation regulatory protein n=1 Tax=Saliterribacillus persicus TaxID=930114 RepID=A0A368XZ72_9BACI|nr:aspartyl-phosphate phosphatase Spo0E family protein [Saliterribacillus persicus]RCW73283.1 Spo0E like sporulation regulatory protein [Saliterribacillus persicus]
MMDLNILEKIEMHREKMVQLSFSLPLTSPEMIRLSAELDEYLNEYSQTYINKSSS